METTRSTPSFRKRLAVCLFSITLMALGVALTTRANLGTTPISALPYVASLGFRPSIGFFTILRNLLLVAIQTIILRKNSPRAQLLQIPVSCLFGFCIDMWMYLLPDFGTVHYAARLTILASGTMLLALGVYLCICADLIMMAGDAAVKVLSAISQKEFGKLRIVFDVTMVILATTLSFLLFKDLRGIGGGTVLSALFVGFFIKQFHTLRTRLAPAMDRRR